MVIKRKVPDKTVFVLGAGFSRQVGLPDTNGIVEKLLSYERSHPFISLNPSIDIAVTKVLRAFISQIFGSYRNLPNLEDLFTCIDLSCNRGLGLGRDYDAAKLRVIRRMLIHRVLSIISDCETDISALDYRNANFQHIKRMMQHHGIDGRTTTNPRLASFVVTNWDTSLERCLTNLFSFNPFNGIDFGISSVDKTLKINAIKVAKVHGSASWVYCPTCDSVSHINDSTRPISLLDRRISGEIENFRSELGPTLIAKVRRFDNTAISKCPRCFSNAGPLIATHSYAKHLAPHPFRFSWERAKDLLIEAKSWVFAGYSLPSSDFEFRHLLKFCQHAKGTRKRITVVVKDCDSACRYKTFFGERRISRLCTEGISGYAQSHTD